MATVKKPMAKKTMGMKKTAKKAAPMMSSPMMKKGGMVKKAKLGTTSSESTKSPMQIYKAMYPDADTSALGDTRFGDEINAYGPKKVLDRIAAGDKAFNAKYGEGKPAVDKPKAKAKVKAKTTKIKAKMGTKVAAKKGMHKMPGGKMMKNSMMKKGGKMSKKAC